MADFPKIIMGREIATPERLRSAMETLRDAVILKTLAGGPLHGFAVSESIGNFSDGLLQ